MSAEEGERGPVKAVRDGALADMIKNAATTTVHSIIPDSPQEHRLDMAVRTALPAELAGADLSGFASLAQASSGQKRLTVQEILDRRAKAGRLVAGAAAASNTDMFKGPSTGKPKAKRWDHYLTAESKAREPCKLKQAAKNMNRPGLLSLGGGMPSPETSPFDSLTVRVPQPPHFDEAATCSGGLDLRIGKYTVREAAAAAAADAGDEDHKAGPAGPVYDLSIALNYAQANGSPQLNRWVAEHTELCFRPPYADWHVSLTIGSTGALEQAMRMLCDRARGDAILTEEFAFATMLETAAPLGIAVVGAAMDEQGLLPESMDAILSGWDSDPRAARGVRRPHVLYTVPSGQNPTGATQGLQRRKDIYAVARKHDLYIIEDEPYYFLQMEPYVEQKEEEEEEECKEASKEEPEVKPSSHPRPVAAAADTSIDHFLDSLVPTMLSLDIDGRVLRMDSFAKVVAPGLRVGWVTGSEQMIERLARHNEVCSQGANGFAQAVLYQLLDETWGHDGYLRWLMHIRAMYTARRDVLVGACEKYLPRDIVSWTPPAAGMFHWMRVDHTKHPQASSRSLVAIEEDIYNRCIENGVLVVCGSWFWTERGTPPSAMFFRATFASAKPEDMTEAIRRFGETIRQSFGRSE